MEKMACDIEAARIVSLPAKAYYIGDFISEDEEASLVTSQLVYTSMHH
jgi:hypothetical protein